jgi:ribA/ribD-fused uncharacterized protein
VSAIDEQGRIVEFRGAFRFLSNFWPVEIVPDEAPRIRYPSLEHAYQAAKTHVVAEKLFVAGCKSPGAAKRAGRRVTMRDDWDAVKIDVMRELLRQKFAPGSELARLLVETGAAEIVEGNTWGDRFWGECDGEGENWLGRLLMEVRDALVRGT